MRRDGRLSLALHLLLHLDEAGRVATSEDLGAMMRTNPAVVRRLMGGLREAGIVRAEKGHGGGWALLRELGSVTLADVYGALGTPAVFSIGHRTERPGCLVEKAVNRAVGAALDDAEAVFMARLRETSVASVAADVRKSISCGPRKGPHAHA